jgi:chitinase
MLARMGWLRCCSLLARGVLLGVASCAAWACSDNASPQGAESPEPAGVADGRGWVMGYYSSWNADRYPVERISWSSLTHLATAFNVPDGAGGLYGPESIEPALARALVQAAHAAGKKAIASIGGESATELFKSSVSPEHLDAFVSNLQELVRSLDYDGLDLDWEGGPEEDRASLLALVQALRKAAPNLIITVPVELENINLKRDLSFYAGLARLIDQLNLMSYNVAGPFDGWKSWHSSPLHWNQDPATPVSIDESVEAYLSAGVPAAKLGIGAGFFGQCYSAPVTQPEQALTGSKLIAQDGVMSYAHIMSAYYSPNARHWDDVAEVPYLSFEAPWGPEGCTYITYEDAESIAIKARWAKSRGLGGAILWTINEGYLGARPDGPRQPLLDAAGFGFLR